MKNTINILWVDDEIEFFEPHIIFLTKKGYKVHSVNSGEAAVNILERKYFNIVLLDEMMTGIDGLETLKIIHEKYPDIPVVMLTKNEEEWLMEEAIASNISHYLIKPVTPSQILMVCKMVLDTDKIFSNITSKEYLKDYNNIASSIDDCTQIKDWYNIYDSLMDWSIRFDHITNDGLLDIFQDQYKEANYAFCEFVEKNYLNWLQSNHPNNPFFANNIIKKFIKPKLDNNDKVILIILDCLRLDQWKILSNHLYPYFRINNECYLSLLPTTTFVSRNALFSGKLPLEIQESYPKISAKMLKDKKSLNSYEDFLLKEQLSELGNNNSVCYTKISNYKQGMRFLKKIDEYRNVDFITVVINFIDILTHSRLESSFIKEILPNHAAQRNIINTWFQDSWLFDMLKKITDWNSRNIYITSDHGSTISNRPIIVKADKSSSTGLRYKVGRSLHVNKKDAMIINNPGEYKLLSEGINSNYIIAKNNNFFVYPNKKNKYHHIYNDSFQHGGISMEEMIIPFVSLNCK